MALRGYPNYKLDKPDSLLASLQPEIRDTGFFFQTTYPRREYYRVETYLDFVVFINTVKPEKRTYDELIQDMAPQKPRFDIDIKTALNTYYPDEAYAGGRDPLAEDMAKPLEQLPLFQRCVDEVVTKLLEELPGLKLERDIVMTTSHGYDLSNETGLTAKCSGHIIVDNYCHLNCKEAEFFCHKIINSLPEDIRKYFDAGIYSSNHCLRIIGNRKGGSDRVKIFQEKWQYKDREIQYQYVEPPLTDNHKRSLQHEASLITATSGCRVILQNMPIITKKYKDYGDLSEEQIELAMAAFQEWWSGLKPVTENAFKLLSSSGSCLTLKRKKSSYCPICDRKHDAIDAYLVVTGDLDHSRFLNLRFGCYQSFPRRTIPVSSLTNPDYQPEQALMIDETGKTIALELTPKQEEFDLVKAANKLSSVANLPEDQAMVLAEVKHFGFMKAGRSKITEIRTAKPPKVTKSEKTAKSQQLVDVDTQQVALNKAPKEISKGVVKSHGEVTSAGPDTRLVNNPPGSATGNIGIQEDEFKF